MEMLSLKECQQAMAALDAADKLNASVEKELSQFKEMDTNAIIKRASKMLMTGNFSLEAFGLNPALFDQIEQLTTHKLKTESNNLIKPLKKRVDALQSPF